VTIMSSQSSNHTDAAHPSPDARKRRGGESPTATPIAVAPGDGIGPEIMDATLKVLEAAGADIAPQPIEIGEQVYSAGNTSGITTEAWDTVRGTGVMLKAPITTPRGSGYKSLNVTLRKSLGLYANVRPCVAYHPFVDTRHPGMDVVIIRENEEDTYGGIEHRQTREVTQCLKLITRPGCEKICRYAFEYARAYGRKKVTCFVKDNIMKQTDGLFRQVFEEVAQDYPDIEADNMIIDIGTAKLADTPEMFDVIVTPNLYGDIVSDVAAQIAGSVGLCGTANIGPTAAMFEAIHGSAPDIAGRGVANPSGLLLAAVQMLIHIGQSEPAELIHNAWLATLEDGIHTGDVFQEGVSKQKVGTAEFADAVVERLGAAPRQLASVSYAGSKTIDTQPELTDLSATVDKQLVGVDVFVDWDERGRTPELLAQRLQAAAKPDLKLTMITNRGTKVWPQGLPETFCTDHWRCRFVSKDPAKPVTHRRIAALLTRMAEHGLDFIKTEHLCTFDGEPGYSKGQGE